MSGAQRGEARRLLADANVEQLRRLGKALGNGAMAGKIAHNDSVRDALLAVIQERLDAVDRAQRAELRALRERSGWWRDLRRGARNVALPEPTRWGEVAKFYRQATVAVCRGDLGRGVDLVRQAFAAERKARKNVPSQVVLPREAELGRADPGVMADVQDGEGCTPCTAPATLALADRIENVSASEDAASRLLNTGRDRVWWAEGEEVEEADEAEQEKAQAPSPGSRRLLEPAAQADLKRRPDVGVPQVAPPVRRVRTELSPRAPEQAEPEGAAPLSDEGPETERPRRRPKR